MRSISDEDLIDFTGEQESQYLATKDSFREAVHDEFNFTGELAGDLLPWSKTHDHVRLRPGEVSVWGGINSHGKSQISGMVALWLSQYTKVMIASLEMMPSKTLKRMCRQAAGSDQPSSEYIDRFMSDRPDNLWIYDQTDSVQSDRIIGLIRYASQKCGVKHHFIDSLVKCGVGTDRYDDQKKFIDRLCWAAKSTKTHIHLVHHVRKTDSEENRPNKFSVKGAGEITDLCDNLFLVWRNKKKEHQRVLKETGMDHSYDPEECDSTLEVAKQRNGEWEGTFNLWFHPRSLQYLPRPGITPMPFELEDI